MGMDRVNEIEVPFSCKIEFDFNNGRAVPDFLDDVLELQERHGWVLENDRERLRTSQRNQIRYSSYTKNNMDIGFVLNDMENEVYFFSNNQAHLACFIQDYNFNTNIVANRLIEQWG